MAKHTHSQNCHTAKSSPQKASFLEPRPFAPPVQREVQPQSEEEQQQKPQPGLNLLDLPHLFDPRPLTPPPLQAKLTIGEPDDQYEQEADNVARQVVGQIHSPQTVQREEMLEEEEEEELQMKPLVQREEIAEEEEEEELQMKPLVQRQTGGEASDDLERSIQQARGSGQTLDSSLRPQMENAMGADFSGVRVHTGPQSDQMNRSIQAKAFTTGQDIFFRQGEYNPGTKSGQELVAHELTHVMQQTQRTVQPGSAKISRRTTSEPIVQRLLMTKNAFLDAGGETEDTKYGTRYLKVAALLGEYHTELATPFAEPQGERKTVYDRFVRILNDLSRACYAYIDNHKNPIAQKKKDRKRTVKEIRESLTAEHNAVQKLSNLDDNAAQPMAGRKWFDLVYEETEPGGGVKTLEGDPTVSEEETSKVKVGSFGAPGTERGSDRFKDDPENSFDESDETAPAGTYETATVAATQENPHQTDAYQWPNTDNLYTVGSEMENAWDPGYQVRNTPANATVTSPSIDAKSLFIDDEPRVDEIAQGGIGDCYYLAALTHVVNKDPDQIKNMMSIDGDAVKVRFYYQDASVGTWLQCFVSVPLTLAQKGGELVGVSYKLAADPEGHDWWVNKREPTEQRSRRGGQGIVTPGNLSIVRRDRYKAALWAPYLEKAMARFADKYGQYGDRSEDSSGFEKISGGASERVYNLFYGSAAESKPREDVSYTQGGDNAVQNFGAIKTLLQAIDQNLKTDDGSMDQQMNVTAGIQDKDQIKRADDALKAYKSDETSTNYIQEQLSGDYDEFNTLLTQFSEQLKIHLPEPQEDKSLLATKAKNIVKPDAKWKAALHDSDSSRPKPVKTLVALATNIINLGTDSSRGQRNIYSGHAYSVMGASFKNSSNEALDLDHKDLKQEQVQNISLEKSTVDLRNPHRANAPNISGGDESGDGKGNFTMTLDDFLMNFSYLRVGLVKGRSN